MQSVLYISADARRESELCLLLDGLCLARLHSGTRLTETDVCSSSSIHVSIISLHNARMPCRCRSSAHKAIGNMHTPATLIHTVFVLHPPFIILETNSVGCFVAVVGLFVSIIFSSSLHPRVCRNLYILPFCALQLCLQRRGGTLRRIVRKEKGKGIDP